MSDLDFDYAPGLPEALPPGETLLWQGKPDWKTLALGAFRLREICAYFGVLAAWRVVTTLIGGGTGEAALTSALWLLPLVVLSIVIITGLAFASARTTIYSLTNRRVVMRIGIALPVSLNLPYSAIECASLGRHANGCGDIPIVLKQGGAGLGFLVLWPHARPWQFKRPQPMLRALPDAERVAMLLGEGLRHVHAVDGLPEVVATPVTREKRAISGTRTALAT